MRQIEFLKTVACDGRTFHNGDVVDADALSLDLLATCLRLGHAREVPAVRAAPGALLTLPNAFEVRPVGPTEDDMRTAVAEIERLRGLATERAEALDLANARIATLSGEIADLRAVKPVAPAPVEAEGEHPPAPEPKADEKAKGEPKPAVGPSKPPELKAGKK